MNSREATIISLMIYAWGASKKMDNPNLGELGQSGTYLVAIQLWGLTSITTFVGGLIHHIKTRHLKRMMMVCTFFAVLSGWKTIQFTRGNSLGYVETCQDVCFYSVMSTLVYCIFFRRLDDNWFFLTISNIFFFPIFSLILVWYHLCTSFSY